MQTNQYASQGSGIVGLETTFHRFSFKNPNKSLLVRWKIPTKFIQYNPNFLLADFISAENFLKQTQKTHPIL